MYAVIIAVCNIRVFICIIIFKPALTNKVVNACPKNTTYISIQNIILHHIYILLYIYIHSSCLHLFWQIFETPCPTKHGMVINLLLYSRESKGLVVAINSFSSFIFSKRAPTTIHSITHSFPKALMMMYLGITIEWFTALPLYIIFYFHKIIQN